MRRTRRGTTRSACPSRVAWASVRECHPASSVSVSVSEEYADRSPEVEGRLPLARENKIQEMSARAQIDVSPRPPLWERVVTWGAFGGALAFGLSQFRGDFAWLVPVAAAVADHWLERSNRPGFGRAALAALLIVLSSVGTEVVIGAFVSAFFGS
jgi:hypothetical protein